MTELLKKGVKLFWNEKCEEAFHTLRAHLTTAPVLAQQLRCVGHRTWLCTYAKQPSNFLCFTST
jgi:hypothetical protein